MTVKENTKNTIRNVCGGVSTTATGPALVIAIAEGATSASAITTSLAVIGFGSMLGGIAVIGAVSVGVFFGVKWTMRRVLC